MNNGVRAHSMKGEPEVIEKLINKILFIDNLEKAGSPINAKEKGKSKYTKEAYRICQ